MHRLNETYGLRYFFGTDDNFFNNKERSVEIIETLAHAEFDGSRLGRSRPVGAPRSRSTTRSR